MESTQFKNTIKKVTGNRKHKVTNSYGMQDAFNYYKKIRPKNKRYALTNSNYRVLIKEVNKLLALELLTSGELKLPLDMGSLKVYKKENKPRLKDNRVVYNAPIDWNRTLDLWSNDNEAKVAKTLVRVMPGDIYSIKYKHRYCKFKNKEYYIFKVHRAVKLKLKDKIIKKEVIPYFNNFKKI